MPGARRRVFYFLGTFSGFGVCTYPEPKKETRKAELEGEVAWVSGFVLTNPELKKADSVSPTRQVSATAGAFRWTRNEKFFDNRKAGKSTPTIVT